MNILHIVSRGDSYDAQSTVADNAHSLSEKGHRVLVASTVEKRTAWDVPAKNVIYLPAFEKNFVAFYRSLRTLKDVIKREHIDVIHVHSSFMSILGFWLARATGKPFLVSCYDFSAQDPLRHALILGKNIIVHNALLQESLIKQLNVDAGKIICMQQPLLFERIRFQEYAKRSVDQCTIGICAPFKAQKGHEYFLKAMVQVVRVFPRITIAIATGLPQSRVLIEEDVRTMVRRLGLAKYTVFFDASHPVRTLLPDLNIVVVPSIREDAATRVMLEAQASGAVVIATQVAGASDMICDRQTGFLVPPFDPNTLSATIIDTLRNHQRACEITSAAHQSVQQRYDNHAITHEWSELYRRTHQERRVLIIYPRAMHAAVTISAAQGCFKQEFPEAKMTSLVPCALRSLVQQCPFNNQLIAYEQLSSVATIKNRLRMMLRLFKQRFDVVINCNPSFLARLTTLLAMSYHREGSFETFFSLLKKKHKKFAHAPNESVHALPKELAAFERCAVTTKKFLIETWPSREDSEFIQNFFAQQWIGEEKVAVIDTALCQRFFHKKRMLYYVAILCNQLAKRNIRIIILEKKPLGKLRALLEQSMQAKPIFVNGMFSLMHIACLLEKSSVYVGADSELLLLAMTLKVPTLILPTKRTQRLSVGALNAIHITDDDVAVDTASALLKSRRSDKHILARTMHKLNQLLQSESVPALKQ